MTSPIPFPRPRQAEPRQADPASAASTTTTATSPGGLRSPLRARQARVLPSGARILPRVLAEIQARSVAMVEILRRPTLPPTRPRDLEASPAGGAGAPDLPVLADPPVPSVMSEDLVRLVGAGVLGAFAQWAFNRVVRRALPPEERGPHRRVLGELRHIREQLDLLQGEIRGLGRRVGSLERGGTGD